MNYKKFNYCLLDDLQLIELVKQEDNEAFEEISSRYYTKLYKTALSILKYHHEAEEVTMDALVKAYHALKYFRGNSKLLTWLYRILTNEAFNRLDWNKRRGSDVNCSINNNLKDDSPQEDFNIPDYKNIPTAAINNQEIELLILSQINSLPAILKETVQLRFLQDLSYEEIAQKQHSSIGTIKSRLFRGRQMLMKKLTSYGISVYQ